MFYWILGKICDTTVRQLDVNSFTRCRSGGRLAGLFLTKRQWGLVDLQLEHCRGCLKLCDSQHEPYWGFVGDIFPHFLHLWSYGDTWKDVWVCGTCPFCSHHVPTHFSPQQGHIPLSQSWTEHPSLCDIAIAFFPIATSKNVHKMLL